MAVWDLPTAQTLLHKQGRFDGISIAAKEGTSPSELLSAVQPLVPASLAVKSSAAQAAAASAASHVPVPMGQEVSAVNQPSWPTTNEPGCAPWASISGDGWILGTSSGPASGNSAQRAAASRRKAR